MNKLLPVALLALLSLRAEARKTTHSSANSRIKTAFNKTVHNKSRNKTTGIYWRVFSMSDYIDNGSSLSLSDSTRYFYSNARGSSFDFGYDLGLSDGDLEGSVYFDSAFRYSDRGNGLSLTAQKTSLYDANNRRIEYSIKNSINYTATYNANNDIIKLISRNWDSTLSKWDTSEIAKRTYNGKGELITDTSYLVMGTISPSNTNLYAYDTKGNKIMQMGLDLFGGPPADTSYREVITYNNNNDPVTYTYMEYNNSKWVNAEYDSMGYNNNGVMNYWLTQTWDTTKNAWINGELTTRTINSNNLPSSEVYSEWDSTSSSWQLYDGEDMFYDNYMNLVRTEDYDYINGTKDSSPYQVVHYYYQVYFDVNVSQTQASGQPLSIYPNPATDMLYIKYHNNEVVNSVTLINMAGATVRSINDQHTGQIAMSVSGLPAGNYILSVNSGNANAVRQVVTIQQ